MKLAEGLQLVCKTDIKAKCGFFKESNEKHLFFYFFYSLCNYSYFTVLMSWVLTYDGEDKENKGKALNERV